jgi:hypothetical protein
MFLKFTFKNIININLDKLLLILIINNIKIISYFFILFNCYFLVIIKLTGGLWVKLIR